MTTPPQPSGAEPPDQPIAGDVARLRHKHPSWRIGTTWATANSRPDVRRLTATRDGILLSAWNAAELSMDIEREERSQGS